MISSRWFKSGLCAAVFALAVPILAQDIPVISSENAAALARTISSEMFAEGSRGLQAIPNSTLLFYESYTAYEKEAEDRLYDAAQGAPGPVFPEYPPSYRIIDYAQDISYSMSGYWQLSPDGRLWAAYYHHGEPLDGPTDLQLIDVATREVAFTLFSGSISTAVQTAASVYFSPGSNFLVLEGQDVSIWNTHTGEQLALDLNYPSEVAFNADETLLVAAYSDATTNGLTVKVWDIETGELIHTIEQANFDYLMSLIMSPRENLMLLNDVDTFTLWNLDTQEQIPVPEESYAVFNKSGSNLITYTITNPTGKITMWNLDTQTLSVEHTGSMWTFLNIMRTRVILIEDGMNSVVMDAETGEKISELKTRTLTRFAVNPDETLLVSYEGRFFKVWSLDTGKELAEFEMMNPDDVPETTVEIDNLQFSADGKAILLLPTFGTVEIWTVGE